MIGLISRLSRLRQALWATGPWDYHFVSSESPLCFGYELRQLAKPNNYVRVIMNWDPTSSAIVPCERDAVTLVSVGGGETSATPGTSYLAPSSAMVTATSDAAIRLLQGDITDAGDVRISVPVE